MGIAILASQEPNGGFELQLCNCIGMISEYHFVFDLLDNMRLGEWFLCVDYDLERTKIECADLEQWSNNEFDAYGTIIGKKKSGLKYFVYCPTHGTYGIIRIE